jgi:hypothetical protein
MKYKNFLILSLAALAATANITFAQETGTRRERAAVIRNDSAVTIVADQDAPAEQVIKTVDAARASGAKSVRIAGEGKGQDGKYSDRLVAVIKRSSPSSRVLVIPKDAGDAKGIADVEEDLNVMAHILDKTVSDDGDKSARAMGIVVPPRPPGSAAGPQNLFIEGYGALFFLNVNYSLVPPPAADTKPETKEESSNEWEEARREISQPQRYGSSGGGGGGGGYQGGGEFGAATPFLTGGGPFPPGAKAAEYDADKVEELKKDLIAALKNAAHIRKLKSDENVTVVISAPMPFVPTKPKTETSTGDRKPEEYQVALEKYQIMMGVFQYTGWTGTSGPSTKLILRVRKSDAEAFQKGNLSFDDFRKKVAVILY